MANEVKIQVTATKSDTSGLKESREDVDKLKDSADKASPAVDKLTDSMTEADKAASHNSKSVSENKRQIDSLSSSIKDSQKGLQELALAFSQTDNAAQKMDLKKAMDRVQSDINAASKAKKILLDLEPHIEPNSSGWQRLRSSITNTAMEAATAWKPILVGAAVGIAPLVGSALAGGIIGGAGVGGVIGGVMLVRDDPRVIGAFTGLSTRIGASLKDSAKPFVDTTVKGLATIEGALDRIDFKSIFAKSATFVQPLSQSLGHLAEDLAGGFNSLIQVADPVIKAISHGLADIGVAARKGMESLADNADTAADGLKTLLDTVATTTTITFGLINGLTELKAQFDKTAGGVFAFDSGLKILNAAMPHADTGGTWVDPVEQFNNAVAAGTTTVDSYGHAITSAGQSLETMAAAALDADNAQRSLFDSATSVGEAEDKVASTISKHNNSLDANTKKGRANREALSGLAGALNSNYEAYVKVNGAGADATAIANSNYRAFIKTATGAGVAAGDAKNLARQLGLIPPKKETKINANTHDAQGRLDAIQDRINGIHGKTVTVTVRTVITGGSLAGGIHVSGPGGSGTLTKASGGITGRAADGSTSGGLTWVGENGPELINASPGTRVWSAGDSARMSRQMGGGGSGAPTQILMKMDPRADPFVQALFKAIRFEVGGNYGNNVQNALSN